jgi:hypothetical protein
MAPATQLLSTLATTTTYTATSPNRWGARTTVTIRNERNELVSGAVVTVGVRYRDSNGTWTNASNLTGTTTSTGALQFDSGLYASGGSNPIERIRFQVLSVTRSGMTWQSNTSTVTANRPN